MLLAFDVEAVSSLTKAYAHGCSLLCVSGGLADQVVCPTDPVGTFLARIISWQDVARAVLSLTGSAGTIL